MKRLGLFCLVLSVVVGTTATSQASYYLDTPHNESNGIDCSSCHSLPAFQVQNVDYYTDPQTGLTTAGWLTRTAADPEDTLANNVCLACHADSSTNASKGPAKVLHSSKTTGSATSWSTNCNQCHDQHYQGQLDWAGPGGFASNPVYLATGNFQTSNGRARFVSPDGSYTTIGISSTITARDNTWKTVSNWKAKGGRMDAGRATDGSRGLILVPSMASHDQTYEIIDVITNGSGYLVLTVKGSMDGVEAINNGAFGVIYGQAIKSSVMPNGTTSDADARDVKFFVPDLIADTSGGYVDLAPNASKPQGLCQVCHDSTDYWRQDGSSASHNSKAICGDCHDALKGLGGGINHRVFIGDFLGTGCGSCHAGQVGAPESGHAGGCNTCHVNPKPTITSNLLANDGGISVRAALTNGGYSFGPRLIDSSGKGIGDSGFLRVDCSECHQLKRAANGTTGSHGGHGASTFGWDANCNDCHIPTGKGVVKDIHDRSCTLCHDSAQVAVGDYTKRIIGNSANGIDGSAVGATSLAKCTDCHNTSSPGVVHHDSRTGYAAAGNCTHCHATNGHQGNHTELVGDYVNCTLCHAANVGSSFGAPVDPDDNKKHDECITCHNFNTTLKTLAQLGSSLVVAMPNGGVGTNNGGGSCASCHGEYFSSHRNADHHTRVDGNTACSACHNGTAGTITGVPTSVTDPKLHDECTSCHQTSGGLKGAYGKALGMIPGGGNCLTCHGSYFPSHKINHVTRVAETSNCNGCHTATAGLPGDMPVNPTDPKVHDACNVCHNDASNNLLKPAYGKASAMPLHGGDCNACHGAYFVNHSNANHTSKVAMNDGCVSCHDGNQGNVAGAPVDPANNLIHDACTTCHDASNGALVGLAAGHPGGGDCLTCHLAGHDTNLAHNRRVITGLATDCPSCHAAGNATAVDTLHRSCQTCHSYNGSRLNPATVAAVIAAGKGGSGTDQNCEACHTINLHHTTREAANNNCTTTCHPAVDHSARVAGNFACVACHTTTAGSVSGISVSLTDAAIHDACRTCHIFDAQWRGTLVNFTNLKGVNGSGGLPIGGGDCSVCHTVATPTPTSATMATIHHASPRTAAGQCESCHPDPRPSWQPVGPGDNGSASGFSRPTQMACLKCHVTFSGGNMTVTKFTRSQYQYYKADWARTTIHNIPVTTGRINNYGICLSCHYQGSAKVPASAQLSVWHANPSRHADEAYNLWDFYDQGWDSETGKRYDRGSGASFLSNGDGAHYVPGRSPTLSSNINAPHSGIAGFNLFAPNYGVDATHQPATENNTMHSRGKDSGAYSGPANDTPSFSRTNLPPVPQIGAPVNATLKATTLAVPVFASLSPISSAPPVSDKVMVKNATQSGGVVTVRASTSNSGGCSTLTATYGATSLAMGGVSGANCTVAFASPFYPTGGSTVDVVTNNSQGLNVFDYPIVSANPGGFAFSAQAYSVSESGGTATITVNRILGSTGAVSVNYITSNGTATAGSDYTAASGVLSWGDGDTADQVITIAINNDAATEGNETIILTLSMPTNGTTLANPNQAVLNIVDDENVAGVLAFSASAYTVEENGGTATITVTRPAGSIGAVSVGYGTNIFGSTAKRRTSTT